MKSAKSVDPQPGIRRQESVTSALGEAATLALESLRAHSARSALSGEPYSAPTDADAQRPQMKAGYAPVLERLGPSIRDVGLELIVPTVTSTRAITARAGLNESDSLLVEGVSPNFYDVVGAEFAHGRPFTDTEQRVRAQVAELGASVARALFGERNAVGQSFPLGGDRYFVVGQLAPRKGTFFGENRNDRVVALPVTTARLKFPDARNMVLYIRAKPGLLEQARREAEIILPLLRNVPRGAESNVSLSSADQIIAQFDRIGAQIFLATIALSAVSLVIGGIRIANVMIISVTPSRRRRRWGPWWRASPCRRRWGCWPGIGRPGAPPHLIRSRRFGTNRESCPTVPTSLSSAAVLAASPPPAVWPRPAAASRSSIATTTTSFSRCCTRWPPPGCRRATSPRPSGGSCAARNACAYCWARWSGSIRPRARSRSTAAR